MKTYNASWFAKRVLACLAAAALYAGPGPCLPAQVAWAEDDAPLQAQASTTTYKDERLFRNVDHINSLFDI